MDELTRQILTYLRGMWHRRWFGLAAAWAVATVGVLVTMKIPERYEATARVSLDTQSILKPLMSGLAVQPDLAQQVAMVSRTLISRPNIERLIQAAGLQDDGSAAQKDVLVDRLVANVQLRSLGRENLFLISYRDANPAYAERVVASLVAMFVEASAGGKRQDAEAARRFIEEQIKVYEKRLEEAENRLKDYKLRHLSVASLEGKDYFARMTQAAEDLSRARLELRAAEQSRDALKRELEGEEPVFLSDAPGALQPAVPEIDGRLDALRKQLDELLRRYTEEHPDVVGTRRIIEDLEAQRRRDLEARRKAAPKATGSLAANPVMQQLRVSLAESEAKVAALRARVVDHEARHSQLRAAAQRVPQIEAELVQLNRDYEIQKKNYEALVSRRESATISGDLGAAGSGAEFRVIDPARVSPTPVAPNRLFLLPLVLVAALAAGLAASLVASQIAPTFQDLRTLQRVGGRPVLGSISLLPSRDLVLARRHANFAFFGALAALVCLYAITFAYVSSKAPVA